MRGLFIVFEGLDHSGKSTQCKLLSEALKKKGKVLDLRFPDRSTKIGKEIDLYLQNKSEVDDKVIHKLFSQVTFFLFYRVESMGVRTADC